MASLDAGTISRIRWAYVAGLDLIVLFREQLDRWRKERLSRTPAQNLEEFKAILDEEERLSKEIHQLSGPGRQAICDPQLRFWKSIWTTDFYDENWRLGHAPDRSVL